MYQKLFEWQLQTSVCLSPRLDAPASWREANIYNNTHRFTLPQLNYCVCVCTLS